MILKKYCSYIPLFTSLVCLCVGCTTGSTLRTARVLEKGELEFSAGVVTQEFDDVAQVVIGAYGITNSFEIEGRCEDNYIALTPRLQLLKSEKSSIDCLAFFELGYNVDLGFQWGPGIMIGKKWDYVEPYLSYRFRHFNSASFHPRESKHYWVNYDCMNVQYVKLGSRFYFSPPVEYAARWFIGLEVGPTFMDSNGRPWEYAANIGVDY